MDSDEHTSARSSSQQPPDRRGDISDFSEYAAIIEQHGHDQIMERIERLERLFDLLVQLQSQGLATAAQFQAVSDPPGDRGKSELADRVESLERHALAARVEELENRVGRDTYEPSPQTPVQQRPRASDSREQDEMANLRLQMSGLSKHLAQAQQELKEVNGTGVLQPRGRRHHRQNLPWWKFW